MRSSKVPNLPINPNKTTNNSLINTNSENLTNMVYKSNKNSKSHPNLLSNKNNVSVSLTNANSNSESLMLSPTNNASSNMMVHRQYKMQDMYSGSVKDIITQPENDNKSLVNKQRVLNKKQDKIRNRTEVLAQANADNVHLHKPTNDWRLNPMTNEQPKNDVPKH
jgi:hypothetical protein